MRKRYIFFDIDNTLTASNLSDEVPASAMLALEKLRKAGHFTAIATGRMHVLAVPFLEKYGFRDMVSDGGYSVTLDGELQFLKPLDRELCIRLTDECNEKGFIWALQTEDSDTRVAPDGRFAEFTRDTYMKTEIVPGLDPRDHENIYKMYIACEAPAENALETLKLLPWCRYSERYLFVEPIDKAYGIRRVVEHFGGDPRDVIVFGDALNDLSMFLPEWTCVAMGNGAPELLARADYVTAPSAEDGLYLACERLGLFED